MSAMRKLLPIICETGIERKLSDDVMAPGAHGYTVTEARGRGANGERDAARGRHAIFEWKWFAKWRWPIPSPRICARPVSPITAW
jgi:hypothetical protein